MLPSQVFKAFLRRALVTTDLSQRHLDPFLTFVILFPPARFAALLTSLNFCPGAGVTFPCVFFLYVLRLSFLGVQIVSPGPPSKLEACYSFVYLY